MAPRGGAGDSGSKGRGAAGRRGAAAAAGEPSDGGPLLIELPDGKILQQLPRSSSEEPASSSGEASGGGGSSSSGSEAAGGARPSSDTVDERLAGNYSQDIVDEVRRYGKPEWEATESSLDPLQDLETFYRYDFKLPPKAHDQIVANARERVLELEALKVPTDPDARALADARRELVQGRDAADLRWLKHKAYYKGVAKVRAAKQQLAALQAAQDTAELEEAEAAAAEAAAGAGAGAGGVPRRQHGQRQGQQQQQRRQEGPRLSSLYSEDEVLGAVSDPSEWEEGWTAPGYGRHPAVLQELRSAFAGALGLPDDGAEARRRREELAAAAEAAAAEQRGREEQLEAARQALLDKHRPYQAYTAEHVERQRRQQQLDAHRRHKQQAFWLSLGLAVGSSVVRWWHRQGGGKGRQPQQQQQQQQRRRRSSGAGSSRRSTRPPTPVMLVPQAIAE